ncbi:MAG: efflux RND transporter permease subunit [Bryobacterales bacterium]|nr:efflux RND transporter permease subunit [Bryobacterales bacterium]
MNPVKASLAYPQVTLILTAMAVAVGIHALLTMPRREDPRITIRTGLVSAIFPGASAEEVENQVTRKIEDRLFRFEEVRKSKTYSTSRNNVVFINVELEDWVRNPDQFWDTLRHDLNELRARELPPGVQGPVVNSDFGDTVAVLLAVHGGRYDYRQLKEYVERIEDELRTIRAVSKLKRYGEQKEQIYITSSFDRISQYATNPLRVIQALQARNTVQYAGSIEAGHSDVPLKTTGPFQTEDQIRRVMVDVSRTTGQPVYIRDLAEVERRYQDPQYLTRFNGQRAVMLSIEMQEGYNIVDFGKEIRAHLDRLRTLLPPDLEIDLVADQPRIVEQRISHFIREFGIAIASVILVTVVLLPFHVAAIAALAIPVTIAITFGIMNAVGVELHQVSIAALIVVLGMVVDDAIVIADNYVELLDQGVPRQEAAWRCATGLAVPVLTATLTIIASFVPLLILTGSVGEFISALPIAVAVSLGTSYVIAMLLTPLLCRWFIKKGLHSPEKDAMGKRKSSVLDRMQTYYGSTIQLMMRRKPLAAGLGLAAFACGVILIQIAPEQFFPSAERDQFVIDLWMPEGTRIEATDAVLRRIENHLAAEKLVATFASFLGQSAPRFYYNVSPEQPAANYGQLLVNTNSVRETPALVHRLRKEFATLAPEGIVIVKELQQGQVYQAPVEVRISGDDITTLKTLGSKVEDILRSSGGSAYVRNDFHEDTFQVRVKVNQEVSNRLGLTNASVAQQLAGGFSGAPVTTFWEGNRAVEVLLRLEENRREQFEDIENAYMTSLVTGARVPLRQVATVAPEWQTSRIVRRNGVRTLSVQSFFNEGHLASEVLNSARPAIGDISLPPGYRIDYGGEIESQTETFSEMVRALLASLLAIFLILLFQFRSITDPLIVMVSIPLALLGAAAGLFLTQNPFGFTAFMGIVSLSGVVVRNAIILVDYINERLHEGHALEESAMEAGQRRLRPIFLTSMAAAVGVTPMILSRSSLWSPLASVIAVGLLFSMFFTLLVVPVLFVLIRRRRHASGGALAVLLLILLAPGIHAETRRLTLPEAVDTALRQNAMLKIARLKAEENRYRAGAARANYFPRATNESNLLNTVERQKIAIPAGIFGVFQDEGPVPPHPIPIEQGSSNLFYTTTTLGQPLTQLVKIRAGHGVALADAAAAAADLKKAGNEIALKVHELYFGLLIARAQKRAAQAQLEFAEARMRDSRAAVEAGNILEVALIGARAGLLENRHQLLAADDRIADLAVEFNDLLGLPLDTVVELVPPSPADTSPSDHGEYTRIALAESPDVRAAEEAVEKARRGVTAAKADYIPELTAFVQHVYQNGVPFLARNNGIFGLRMNWDLFDFGKRRSVIGEREALLAQAEENLRRQKNRVSVEVEKAVRKLERARQMLEVAREALHLRRENERLTADQVEVGVASASAASETRAAAAKAEADLLRANLGYLLAHAELQRTIGRTPR